MELGRHNARAFLRSNTAAEYSVTYLLGSLPRYKSISYKRFVVGVSHHCTFGLGTICAKGSVSLGRGRLRLDYRHGSWQEVPVSPTHSLGYSEGCFFPPATSFTSTWCWRSVPVSKLKRGSQDKLINGRWLSIHVCELLLFSGPVCM